MVLEFIVGFLAFDAIMAIIFWLLTANDFRDLDDQLTQAEKVRDRVIEDWLQAQDQSLSSPQAQS